MSTGVAATHDEQRRAFRAAGGLAEAAALADSLAARLTEERRALALARQALAEARAEADESDKSAADATAAARRAAAKAEETREAARAEETRLAQAQQRNARLRQEIASAVARASAHEEALRALEQQADQLATAVAEAKRLSAERDASAAAAEQAAEANLARLEAAETRAANLRRAADAAEKRAASHRAELDAAQRAAAATEREIAAVEERAARLKVRSAAATASLAREIARLSDVSAASQELPGIDEGSGPAGAPKSLLAYAETVSPLLPPDGTIAGGTGGDNADRARLATAPAAEPSPVADGRGDAEATETEETGGEEAGGLERGDLGVATTPQAERSSGSDLPIGVPAADAGVDTAEDGPGAPLAVQSPTEPTEADRSSAPPPANAAREDTVALASYGGIDVTLPSSADPVFSAHGIGTVSISAPEATMRFALAENVEAELAFGGPEDFDRLAATVAANDGADHFSRAFENAFVKSGIDEAVDDRGYYTLGFRSSGRSAILRLRFAATPAGGATQAVRDVVNAVACSALFGSASLPCREQQLGTTAAGD